MRVTFKRTRAALVGGRRQFIIVSLAVICSLSGAGPAHGQWTWQIEPSEPSDSDSISVEMSFYGTTNCVIESSHSMNGNSLVLNVSVCPGLLPIIGWWPHSHPIGRLENGSYDLSIQVDFKFGNFDCETTMATDSVSTSFSVGPTAVKTVHWSQIKKAYREQE